MMSSQSGSRRSVETGQPPPVVRLRFTPQTREPEKVRVGDVVFADGVRWDPGAGEGLYVRMSGGWVKL